MTSEAVEYLKIVAMLAITVIAVFLALKFLLPKLAAVRRAVAGPLNVAYQLTLEPRKTIYVVRAGAQYVMLAASDSGVQFLTALDAGAIELALQQSAAESRRSVK